MTLQETSSSLPDDATMRRVAALAQAEAGLEISASKAAMVKSRLNQRLRRLGLATLDSYLAFVESADGAEERQRMISALTTNVTQFRRENHHFETLRQQILPPLLKRARSGGRLRIWSAGCSSGEEPYTIAMEVLKLEPQAHRYDVRILASDISYDALERACRGVYTRQQIQTLPAQDKSEYFTHAAEDSWAVSHRLKDLIAFRRLNLMETWPMKGKFDVIFCRNVVIYFNDATQARLWRRFRDAIAEDGWLFVGHSERVQNDSANGFAPVGVTTYRAAAPGSALPPQATGERECH